MEKQARTDIRQNDVVLASVLKVVAAAKRAESQIRLDIGDILSTFDDKASDTIKKVINTRAAFREALNRLKYAHCAGAGFIRSFMVEGEYALAPQNIFNMPPVW